MAYKRVTKTERNLIRMWRQARYGLREIARRLGRSPSTISREIAKNSGGNGYQPHQAHAQAQARAKRPGVRRFTEEVKKDAEARLKDGWTPDMIGGRARLEGRPWVCKETIYKHIYVDAKAGGDLWMNLPRAHRKRRRRCPKSDRRYGTNIANQRMIDTRPADVDARSSVGHWEGDLINGAGETGNLVTLVERKTRFTLVGRTKTKKSKEVGHRMCQLFKSLPAVCRLSLTLDNGPEFAQHEKLARKTGMDVFFARPYHAWERGSNENVNGLIRRLHPKKTSFSGIAKAHLKRVDSYVNDRPRKCLGWRTPREDMDAFLAIAL